MFTFVQMRFLKHSFDFYLNSSIHVSLAVCALLYVTYFSFHIVPDKVLLGFVFFASVTGYNFVKYFGLAKFHHRSLARWLKEIQLFSFGCFLAMCYFLWQLPFETWLFIGVFAGVTFLYAIPFLPRKLLMDSKQNLRSVGGVKVYVIALVWSGVTVFLPAYQGQYSMEFDVYLEGFQRFLMVVVFMLPFEIHDLQYDSLKLATIPQKIGVKYTKVLGLVLLFVGFLSEFLKDELELETLVVKAVISIVTGLFLCFAKTGQSEYYSRFWVEALPLLWCLLMWLV